jgi:hypothetical protein
LKEAKKRRIATLRPLFADGIVPEQPKCDEDDDNDSGISSHGTGSNGNGSIPSPDLSKTELARRLSTATFRNPVYLKAKVLWDFEPKLKNTELKVAKGEIIHLLYRDNDKVLAINSQGKRGFIPLNYCSLPHRKIDAHFSSKESLFDPTKATNKPRKQLYSNVSFHEFLDDMDLLNNKNSGKHTRNSETQPDFKSLQNKSFSEEGLFGNISSSSEEDEGESFCFRKTSGIPDMITWDRKAPERFRQRQKVTVSHFRKCDDMNMLVLYDFVAQDENDIDIYKGDLVRVLNTDDRDWWWVVTRSGYEGFVPCSYLTRRSVVSSTGTSIIYSSFFSLIQRRQRFLFASDMS